MKSTWVVRPGAAEFPHENTLIDRGTLWMGTALCGAERLEPVVVADTAARQSETREECVDPPAPCVEHPEPRVERRKTGRRTAEPRDERVETFVRTIADVARAHGPAETAAHVESLFKFGTPAPLDLSPSARAALLDGNILEATEGGVHATAWFARTSSAWQSMLRGDGGNLAECGESTLDGWTADLIARLVAKPNMASTIRRDLRRRGIAAFGMLDS
jgi:hypothetical protein